MHPMNGLKNLLAIGINSVAAVYFIASHAVVWHDVAVMAAASIAGGLAGARLAHRLGRRFVRGVVVVLGLTITVVLAVKVI
jgi:uncharacterized membrane protein YfcA